MAGQCPKMCERCLEIFKIVIKREALIEDIKGLIQGYEELDQAIQESNEEKRKNSKNQKDSQNETYQEMPERKRKLENFRKKLKMHEMVVDEFYNSIKEPKGVLPKRAKPVDDVEKRILDSESEITEQDVRQTNESNNRIIGDHETDITEIEMRLFLEN